MKKSAKLLELITKHSQTHGVPPTLKELAAPLGISFQAVAKALKRLETAGRIIRKSGERRCIEVVDMVEKQALEERAVIQTKLDDERAAHEQTKQQIWDLRRQCEKLKSAHEDQIKDLNYKKKEALKVLKKFLGHYRYHYAQLLIIEEWFHRPINGWDQSIIFAFDERSNGVPILSVLKVLSRSRIITYRTVKNGYAVRVLD